jgi:hypothetical protein
MRTLHLSIILVQKGEAGFDNNARHYKFDDFIGKTRHMVFGKHLCVANAGAFYDFAGVVIVCRAA